MKNKIFLLALSMSLLQVTCFAQNDFFREPDMHKPLLFADLPAVLPVTIAELEKPFKLSPGAVVSIDAGPAFFFQGVIRSVTPQNDNKLLTVIIRLTNRGGSNLTLSAITGDDGVITYTAKVLSFKHGDCFVLQKDEEQHYFFVKKNFYEVVGE